MLLYVSAAIKFTMNHCEMVYLQENKCRAAYQADDAKSILPSDAGKVISLLNSTTD